MKIAVECVYVACRRNSNQRLSGWHAQIRDTENAMNSAFLGVSVLCLSTVSDCAICVWNISFGLARKKKRNDYMARRITSNVLK